MNDLKEYGVVYDSPEQDEGFTVEAPIAEYEKMYDENEFKRLVTHDGGHEHVGTIDRIKFQYNNNSKVLSFGAFVRFDD